MTIDTKQKKATNSIFILSVILCGLIIGNLLFLIFAKNEGKTINLLQGELMELEQNQKIVKSAKEISTTYSKEIELISEVFPNEEKIPVFIQELESEIRNYATEYNFRFNATSPITEQNAMYLPMTLTLRTELDKLLEFLSALEKLPYMTHINSIITKVPDGFLSKGETIISIKLYVQNPFYSK